MTSTTPSGSTLVDVMRKYGIPLTMANWLGLEFPDGPPPEGWQNDLDVPEEIQDAKRWYKDAKVVDENGDPLRLYHATHGEDFDEFSFTKKIFGSNSNHPMAALGVFAAVEPASSDDFARRASKKFDGPYLPGARQIPLYFALKNPFEVDWQEFMGMAIAMEAKSIKASTKEVSDLKAKLIKDGYDGLKIKGGWTPNMYMGGPEFSSDNYVAFEKKQIKSPFNEEFDIADPRFSIGHRSHDGCCHS